jgi:hypothetical protein
MTAYPIVEARRTRGPDERLNEIHFNVRDFGGIGSGAGDEARALQEAADACIAAGGGVVYVPAGTWRLATAVTFRAGVVLRGAGLGRTIINAVGAGCLAWTEASLTDINGGGMEHCTLRCDAVTAAVTVSNVWGWFCRRNHIWGAGALATAIALRGFSFECDISNNRITDFDTAGISFADIGGGAVYPNGTTIRENDFAGDDGATCVAVVGASTVRVVDNHFEHAAGEEGPAVTLAACKGAYIAGNWIGANYGTSNQITVGAGTLEARIHGNHVSLTGGTGIHISGAATGYISVVGNCFDVDFGVDVVVVDGRNAINIASNIVKMIDSGAEGLTGSVVDLKNSATEISISDLVVNAEGAADMAGTGINIGNGCVDIAIHGGCIINMTTGIASASLAASKTISVMGMAIAGNGTQVSVAAATAITLRDCPGHRTSGKGNGTIPSGATTVQVAHGLAVTPPSDGVQLTQYGPSTNHRQFWVNATDATNITVNCNLDPGASGLPFAWSYQPD